MTRTSASLLCGGVRHLTTMMVCRQPAACLEGQSRSRRSCSLGKHKPSLLRGNIVLRLGRREASIGTGRFFPLVEGESSAATPEAQLLDALEYTPGYSSLDTRLGINLERCLAWHRRDRAVQETECRHQRDLSRAPRLTTHVIPNVTGLSQEENHGYLTHPTTDGCWTNRRWTEGVVSQPLMKTS